MCHLDSVVLQQTWLCLASDSPSDACLKQCGSVDEFCYRQHERPHSRGSGRRGSESNGSDGDDRRFGSGPGGKDVRGTRQVRNERSTYVSERAVISIVLPSVYDPNIKVRSANLDSNDLSVIESV